MVGEGQRRMGRSEEEEGWKGKEESGWDSGLWNVDWRICRIA